MTGRSAARRNDSAPRRWVIDVDAPLQGLSRSQLRRLRRHLDLEVVATASMPRTRLLADQAQGPGWDQPADGGPWTASVAPQPAAPQAAAPQPAAPRGPAWAGVAHSQLWPAAVHAGGWQAPPPPPPPPPPAPPQPWRAEQRLAPARPATARPAPDKPAPARPAPARPAPEPPVLQADPGPLLPAEAWPEELPAPGGVRQYGDGRPGRDRHGSKAAPARSGGRRRTPLLIRTTIVVGVVAAVAASVSRADTHSGTGVRLAEVPPGAPSAADSAAQQSLRSRGAAATAASRSRSGVPSASAQPAAGVQSPAASSQAGQPGAPAGAGQDEPGTGAGDACHVSYSVAMQPAAQFTLVIVVANTSSKPVQNWTLRWDFPAAQKIMYGWNAMVSNGPAGAMATGIGNNRALAPGASTTLAVVGQRQAWVPTPTGFTLNGKSCDWQPTESSTVPLPTPTLSP